MPIGADFAAEAKSLSKCPSGRNGGDLGKFSRGKMVKEFDAVAFDLDVGQLSEIVKTQFGYHILKLDEIIPSQLIPFSETKTDIMNLLLKMKTRELFETYVEDLGEKAEIQVFI